MEAPSERCARSSYLVRGSARTRDCVSLRLDFLSREKSEIEVE
jgi:hypothetical protein